MLGFKINKFKDQRLPIAVKYTCTALLAAFVFGCSTPPAGPTTAIPGTTYGKIYVDTPEVYSRERLVNDRFRQDEWLREKLREIPKQGFQGGIGTSSQTSTSLALAVGVSTEAPPKEQLAKAETRNEIEDTPIEQLRDAMAYREEVRNEILENQLDDRHDIAGNTLYRLKFDATVIPLNDTSAYAMVEVTIKGSSLWSVIGEDAKVKAPESMSDRGVSLPDYDFARYVTGVDNATIEFYGQVYENWVKDIDSSKYSVEDIWYGPLQGYFDYDNATHKIVDKTHCEFYGDEAVLEAARNELIARGVPREYLRAQTNSAETEGISAETGERITILEVWQQLCVQTGLANFMADIRDHNTVLYTYAVTPKERAQRVYENTLSGQAAGISVGAEQGAVGASLAHSNAREARANAIMRQPQLVGYSPNAGRSGEATMGWLIGPRYKISSDPNGSVSFRHVPTQYTLTGIVSVPSWWKELEVTTRTYWLDEDGIEYTQEGQVLTSGVEAEKGSEVKITLPADVASIVDILDPIRREPKVDATSAEDEQIEFRACEPGTVVIRGNQLWRSTVVTLGGQAADSISVLPNMKGVIATFNLVQPSISGSESLYLWTSEGEQFVRDISVIGECKINPAS